MHYPSTQYRSRPTPDTPLTPQTPRSPHAHSLHHTPSSRLRSSPTLSASPTSTLVGTTDLFALAHARRRQKEQQQQQKQQQSYTNDGNVENTPSIALSMDLNVLALGNNTPVAHSPSVRVAVNRRTRRPSSPTPTSASRASAIPSGEISHRYPTRTSGSNNHSNDNGLPPFSARVNQTLSTNVAHLSSPPRRKVALTATATTEGGTTSSSHPTLLPSPPRSQSSSQQFMEDEENNLFLASSPKAIRRRTPQRPTTPKLTTLDGRSPALTAPIFSLTKIETMLQGSTSKFMEERKENDHDDDDEEEENTQQLRETMATDENDDDATETASTHSSSIDLEKENTTPKFTDDHFNPFLVGGSYTLKDTKKSKASSSSSSSSSSKVEGTSASAEPSVPSTPTSSSGVVRRSKRLALDSLSPWRWNGLEEQFGLAHGTLSAKMGKGAAGAPFIESCGSPSTKTSNEQNAISAWVESTFSQGIQGAIPGSSSTQSTSSSHRPIAAARRATRQRSGQNSPSTVTLAASSTTAAAAASSSSSSSSSSGIAASSSSPSSSSSKGTQIKLPDNHPNSAAAAERRSSATVTKVTRTIIQPASIAFNRRAQQVAGRIYYWRNGSYHLVSEQDKHQWPGEWKFEVYQDPESPVGTPSVKSSGASSPTGAYHGKGKGKVTDRPLCVPSTKRRRLQREPSMGLGDSASGDASPGGSRRDLETGLTHKDVCMTPPSPSSPTTGVNRNPTGIWHQTPQAAKLQDRYDFRERRMMNSPLSTPSRRSLA
ncbi:hypothetical protein BGZ94_003846 [Podila epigama]|nr:hypothetical protein BGZ94_003846 [Podila epigama]